MYHDKKLALLRLVSSPYVAGGPLLACRASNPDSSGGRYLAEPADAYRSAINDISVDLIILAARTQRVLTTLNQTGNMHEQFLRHLGELLQYELAGLLGTT
jgi:hypothetical protein